MDIFLRFDTCPYLYKKDVLNHGTFINHGLRSSAFKTIRVRDKRKPKHKEFDTAIFASTTGFNIGIHEWKIKILSSSSSQSIGVITKLNQSTKSNHTGNESHDDDDKMIHIDGDSYFINAYTIRCGGKTSPVYKFPKIYHGKTLHQDDVITVHINCNKSTMKFRINGKLIKNKFKIAPYNTYYPAIVSYKNHTQYQLISTRHIWS